MSVNIGKKLFKGRTALMIITIVWLVLAIILIAPVAYTIVDSATIQNGNNALQNFLEHIADNILSFSTFFKIFDPKYVGTFGKVLFYYTLAFMVFTVIGLIKTKTVSDYDDIEHGSADWSTGGAQYSILSKNKGIILAERNYLPVDKRGNINVLVVGGSGAGKSASYSIPNACQMLGSYVFTDPKGELFDKTSGFLKANGYEIKCLNLVNPEASDGYNPLLHIESNIDVDIIANTVVKGQKSEAQGSSDPFWDDSAETLLKSLIYYLISARPPEEQSLASCSEMVRAANSNGGNNMLTNLMNQLPMDSQARMNYKSIEIAPEKTYSSILSTLQSKLSKFDTEEIADVTSTDTIKFEDLGNKKVALYVISSDTHTAYDFLLTIFFSQLIQKLYNYADENGGALKNKVFFILDEFANIGKIPDFDKKISTSRSRGIQFSVILQNLDQLEAVYEKSYETIMGNCDTHLFLGSNSYKTVEYFSKALGETTVFRHTNSISRDKNFNKQGFSGNEQEFARALMTPDELRRMGNDECIIYEKGIKPVRGKKFYYFTHKDMNNKVTAVKADHNDYIIERGNYRKFNPYNPYTEENKDDDFSISSIDDLFADDVDTANTSGGATLGSITGNQPAATTQASSATPNISGSDTLTDDDMLGLANTDVTPEKIGFEDIAESVTTPINTQDEDVVPEDIQKELEAKFDELFGSMEDTDNDT